jgi:hypothetical protein
MGTSTMASSSLLVCRRNSMSSSSSFVWLALVCLWVMAVPVVHALSNKNAAAPASTTTTLIQVCQNKDCCKRLARSTSSSLVEIMENLMPPSSSFTTTAIRVEASGCLSQCDKGPNVQITKVGDSSRPQIHFGVTDVIAAASILELSLPDNFEVPSKLLAATDCLMQANEGETQSIRTPLL